LPNPKKSPQRADELNGIIAGGSSREQADVPNRAEKQEHPTANVILYKIDRSSLPSHPQMKICAQPLVDVGRSSK
jgi:hypothetical protein